MSKEIKIKEARINKTKTYKFSISKTLSKFKCNEISILLFFP